MCVGFEVRTLSRLETTRVRSDPEASQAGQEAVLALGDRKAPSRVVTGSALHCEGCPLLWMEKA